MAWYPTKLDKNGFNVLNTKLGFKFLSKDVDENQTDVNINVNGDYSNNLTDFKITAKIGFYYVINELSISYLDVGTITTTTYGMIPELTNGIDLLINDESFMNSKTIKSNSGWRILTSSNTAIVYPGGYRYFFSYIKFNEIGRPVILNGDKGDSIIIRANDDLSGLTEHYFHTKYLKIKKD